MSKETKLKLLTAAQTDVLCAFFEENPEVIKGYKRIPKRVEEVQNKWKKITPQLNSLGPARNHKAWAKYLCDMKAKLKRKIIKWKENSDGTGPIICNSEDFNEIKLRMLQVLKKDAASSQNSHDSNSDSEVEDDNTINDEHDIDDSGEIVTFPLCEVKNEPMKDLSRIKLLKNAPVDQQTPPEFVNQNDAGDEFDTFGKNIAQQLKTLPLPVALETQEMLLSIMRKQRLKVFNGNYRHLDPLNEHT